MEVAEGKLKTKLIQLNITVVKDPTLAAEVISMQTLASEVISMQNM
jgi:hypothetical protein